MPRPLPKELTSYDFLKTFAVVFMIIDHIGFYFYPEEDWLRVLGRLCVPAWFFLIGYAQSRDLGLRMWIGAALLFATDMMAGLYVMPPNILVTMLLIRMVIDPFMERVLAAPRSFWPMAVMLALLALPTGYFFVEYGTLGFMLAVFGYLVRHKEEIGARDPNLVQSYFLFVLASFTLIQAFAFGFSLPLFYALFAGILAVLTVLYYFRPALYPRLTAALPHPLVWLLQLTGRRTLEIYVGHLVLFKLLGLIFLPDRFVFFDWHLFHMTPEAVFPEAMEAPAQSAP